MLLDDAFIWLCFPCGFVGCPARLYVCGVANNDETLVIRRSIEPHVHGAAGCVEHKVEGPCALCTNRGSCTQLPCFMACSVGLKPGSLAATHQLAVAQIALAASAANSRSPQVLYQVRIHVPLTYPSVPPSMFPAVPNLSFCPSVHPSLCPSVPLSLCSSNPPLPPLPPPPTPPTGSEFFESGADVGGNPDKSENKDSYLNILKLILRNHFLLSMFFYPGT